VKPVTQTVGYVDDDNRGNCMAACLATIFELPLSAVPRKDNREKIQKWLDKRVPGVTIESRSYDEPHPKYPFEQSAVFNERPPLHNSYWIATVKSPRFTTTCNRCWGQRKIQVILDTEARRKRTIKCHRCDGSGRQPGLHAVVMQYAKLAWDPSPQRDMGHGGFHGETLFIVGDPARLRLAVASRVC
jgi:hypothetical protein